MVPRKPGNTKNASMAKFEEENSSQLDEKVRQKLSLLQLISVHLIVWVPVPLHYSRPRPKSDCK